MKKYPISSSQRDFLFHLGTFRRFMGSLGILGVLWALAFWAF